MPHLIKIQDLADILIMSFLLYQLYRWFRGSRAMQVLIGLGVVTIFYFATRFLGLQMTSWILQELGTVLVILVIVVFQQEIRQALYRLSMLQNAFWRKDEARPSSGMREIAEAAFELARDRVGALIVIQRSEVLDDHALHGVVIDAQISHSLISSLFMPDSPLHDGAVVIRNGRIALASCNLPLSTSHELPRHMGTRHRAALGLSERTDAIVVVVSEERGTVSVASGGDFAEAGSLGDLLDMLERLSNPVSSSPLTLPGRLKRNMLPKIATLGIVLVFWVLTTSRQGELVTVTATVRYHGLPDSMVITRNMAEDLNVQLKSRSSLIPVPSNIDVYSDIDLSRIQEGQNNIRITPESFRLPPGMTVVSVNPPSIKISAERKARRRVPVKVQSVSPLPGDARGMRLVAVPAEVEVEGPASVISRIESVQTEPVDGSKLKRGQEYEKGLSLPDSRIALKGAQTVTLRLVGGRRGK